MMVCGWFFDGLWRFVGSLGRIGKKFGIGEPLEVDGENLVRIWEN